MSAETILARVRAQSDLGMAPLLQASVPGLIGEAIVDAACRSGFQVTPSRDGPVAVVAQGAGENDFSHNTGPFDWHKDGLYRAILPDFVLLYCLAPGRGDNPTVVADSAEALDGFDEPTRIELERSELVYVSSTGEEHPRKLVQSHPRTKRVVVHVAQRGWSREAAVRPSQSACAGDLLSGIRARLEMAVVHQQRWKAGDVLIFDNVHYAHARKAERPDPERRLLRIWLKLEDC